ncbi:tail fiber assembly protein [Xenorhabdus nematophila]|uniref:tail fiber assembly protein n=1 Tax=Xenorhabdus nematophila TaxID=628 RepID=UPI0032B7133B
MKYYMDNAQQIYAYDDWVEEIDIKPGLTPITEANAMAIANPPPTLEQLQQQGEREKQYRMSQASSAITPLQYAVDLNMATDTEKAALTTWKRYCVLLNRVDCTTAPDILWPEQPK